MRSLYAARLAICEIIKADSGIPEQCDLIMQRTASFKGGRASLSNTSKQQLGQCIQSLESRPQWWTSYSNSRQNAVVICQAARVDIEKGNAFTNLRTLSLTVPIDEMLKLHKSFIETQLSADDALRAAVKESMKQLSQSNKAYESLKRTVHSQILQEIASASQQARSFIHEVIHNIDSVMVGVSSKISSLVKGVEDDVTRLQNVSLSPFGSCRSD